MTILSHTHDAMPSDQSLQFHDRLEDNALIDANENTFFSVIPGNLDELRDPANDHNISREMESMQSTNTTLLSSQESPEVSQSFTSHYKPFDISSHPQRPHFLRTSIRSRNNSALSS